MKKTMFGAVFPAALMAALAGCGGDRSDDAKESEPAPVSVDFTAAHTACTPEVEKLLSEENFGKSEPLPVEAALTLVDDGKTATVQNLEPSIPYLEDASVLAMTCMLRETKAPDSVVAEIGQASGLAGRQEAAWDDISVSYGYSAGTGFSAVFTVSE